VGNEPWCWYLKRTTQQLETQRVAAILLVIIGLVLVAEIGSGFLRRRISRMK
jgi:phosphonate transport system permease protein